MFKYKKILLEKIIETNSKIKKVNKHKTNDSLFKKHNINIKSDFEDNISFINSIKNTNIENTK